MIEDTALLRIGKNILRRLLDCVGRGTLPWQFIRKHNPESVTYPADVCRQRFIADKIIHHDTPLDRIKIEAAIPAALEHPIEEAAEIVTFRLTVAPKAAEIEIRERYRLFIR